MRSVLVVCLLFFAAIEQNAANCENDIQEYIQGLSPMQPQLWSLEMLDSAVKYPQAEIFEATFLVQLGNYDQCIAIKGPNDESGTPRFKGQYCHFNYGFQLPELDLTNETLRNAVELGRSTDEVVDRRGSERFAQTVILPITWAVCAPSSCGEEGIKKVADYNLAAFSSILGVEANTSIAPNSCYFEGDGSKSFDVNTWCFVVFVSIVAFWICISTVYQYFNPDLENVGWKILVKSFSLQTNVGGLIKLPSKPTPGQLGCLHGIRVISIMWIILGHTYSIGSYQAMTNYISFRLKLLEDWRMAPLLNAFLSVDTFLFLSGLLVTYVPLMDHSKGRKFNICKYYIYRYLRITPALAFVIWYLTSLNYRMSHGPMWYIFVGFSKRACTENWWPTLLYITNYLYSSCIGQTWYLMVDMQLALLAPIVIFPLIKWPKYGFGLIGILTCASLGAMFGVTYLKNYPWTAIIKPGVTTGKYMVDFYPNTIFRGVPYLVGMALGYLLSRKAKIQIPRWAVALGWTLSTMICLTIIFSIMIVYDDSYVYEPVAAAFYASLHKLGWGLALGWIVWACVNGYGGPVNSILAWKFFLPLSKISFAAYLVHTDLIYIRNGLRRSSNFTSNFEMSYLYFGHLFMCLPVAVLLHIAIEAPIMNVLRSVFRKTTPDSAKLNRLQKIN